MQINRREFVKSAAAAGAFMVLPRAFAAPDAAQPEKTLKIALIGAGTQGRVLLRDSMQIPGIKLGAICDIWAYSQKYSANLVKKFQDEPAVYADYMELLEKEKGLDAAIVATPDCFHAPHAIACMEAGLDVYCEKEMAPSTEIGKSMVEAAKKTGKLLQIGHQRRSNPVYLCARDLLRNTGICGRLTNCYGQWHRPVQPKLTWPAQLEIPADELKKYGYDNMDEFRNWRWYRKYSGGPIADLGSHQIDIFSWFLDADPMSISAIGGNDYYPDREWYEDVMVMYEYATALGSARAFYQVLNTNGYANYFERFAGDKGTLTISEDSRRCYYVPEAGYEPPEWMFAAETVERDGYQALPLVKALTHKDAATAGLMNKLEEKTIHQWHLENFYEAVRAKNPESLNCPASEGYKTAVAVLNVMRAVESGEKLKLTEADYRV